MKTIAAVLTFIMMTGVAPWLPSAMAWNAQETHRILADHAAKNSSMIQPRVLSVLELETPVTVLGGKTPGQWVQDGADFEDAGSFLGLTGRFYNHFHNPFLPWTQAGLNDTFLLIPLSGESALLWAQDPASNPDWSWQSVRSAYYQALTLPDLTDRQQNAVRLFQGIGHQIHLVQDMAVPAHTRNDAHPLDDKGIIPGLEYWAKSHRPQIDSYATAPVGPNINLNLGLGEIPISLFFDTDQYDGTAATLPTAGGTAVGLSEYSNANFFSQRTIDSPLRRHQFPFPSTDLSRYFQCDDASPPGSLAARRIYLSRTPCGSGPIDHFLTVDFLEDANTFPVAALDDRVHEDYARQLIPRAVGYSIALIDYFFRGDITVQRGPTGGILIANHGNEDIAGAFELYYDAKDGMRRRVVDGAWTDSVVAGTTGDEKTFTRPNDAQNPCQYLLVFRGRLGNEPDAVAAVLFGADRCAQVVTANLSADGILTVAVTDGIGRITLDHPAALKEEHPDKPFQGEILKAVRFDVADQEQFGVLTRWIFVDYRSDRFGQVGQECCDQVRSRIYFFKIDKINRTIEHTRTQDYPEFDLQYSDTYTGIFCSGDWWYGSETSADPKHHIDHRTAETVLKAYDVVDFYLSDGSAVLFGGVYERRVVTAEGIPLTVDGPLVSILNPTHNFGVTFVEKVGIVYGAEAILQTVTSHQPYTLGQAHSVYGSGCYLEWLDYNWSPEHADGMTPIAVLNSSDAVYRLGNHVVAPIELGAVRITPFGPWFKSMIAREGAHSFLYWREDSDPALQSCFSGHDMSVCIPNASVLIGYNSIGLSTSGQLIEYLGPEHNEPFRFLDQLPLDTSLTFSDVFDVALQN